jgi:hypothetical protein
MELSEKFATECPNSYRLYVFLLTESFYHNFKNPNINAHLVSLKGFLDLLLKLFSS